MKVHKEKGEQITIKVNKFRNKPFYKDHPMPMDKRIFSNEIIPDKCNKE